MKKLKKERILQNKITIKMNRKLRFIVKEKLYALVKFLTFTSDRKSCAHIEKKLTINGQS